eukprot:503699-Pelagomonas_calceolata.AAC.1
MSGTGGSSSSPIKGNPWGHDKIGKSRQQFGALENKTEKSCTDGAGIGVSSSRATMRRCSCLPAVLQNPFPATTTAATTAAAIAATQLTSCRPCSLPYSSPTSTVCTESTLALPGIGLTEVLKLSSESLIHVSPFLPVQVLTTEKPHP